MFTIGMVPRGAGQRVPAPTIFARYGEPVLPTYMRSGGAELSSTTTVHPGALSPAEQPPCFWAYGAAPRLTFTLSALVEQSCTLPMDQLGRHRRAVRLIRLQASGEAIPLTSTSLI